MGMKKKYVKLEHIRRSRNNEALTYLLFLRNPWNKGNSNISKHSLMIIQ